MLSNNELNLRARAAGTYNDPFEPYFNQTYERPSQVKALYPDPDVVFETPAFTKEDRSFTTHEEMMHFLREVVSKGKYVQMEMIGQSLEGRDIPMLVFSTSAEKSAEFQEKPTVWLQAFIHGSEPAAGEAALVIANELAHGSLAEVLDDINVVIIPRMNPDSAYYFDRNSTTNLNGNRDYLNVEMIELQILHEAYNRFTPEVVIDAHEYGAMPQYDHIGEMGALKADDVLLLPGKNLNIPTSIQERVDDWFIQEPFKALHKKGYLYDEYYVVTKPHANPPVVIEGGLDAGTGRNTFALKPSFSVLVETLGITIGRDSFLRRVDSQVVTHESIIRTCTENAKEVKAIIAGARKEIIEGAGEEFVILESKQTKQEGRIVKAVDIAKGSITELDVEYYSSKHAIPTIMRKRPIAYILPPAFGHIVEKIEQLGARVHRIAEGIELEVECYTVLERKVSNSSDRPLSHLKTSIAEQVRYFEQDSYVIIGAQSVAYLVSLALEPESIDSYFTYNFVPVYVGGELPLYRYMMDDLSFLGW